MIQMLSYPVLSGASATLAPLLHMSLEVGSVVMVTHITTDVSIGHSAVCTILWHIEIFDSFV